MGGDDLDRAHALAKGFVEINTDYRFTEVPSEVRGLLIKAAQVLLKWHDKTHDTNEVPDLTEVYEVDEVTDR